MTHTFRTAGHSKPLVPRAMRPGGVPQCPQIPPPDMLVLEALAVRTWHLIESSHRFHSRLGEETITEINTLSMKLDCSARIYIPMPPTKDEEARKKFDWEWYVQQRSGNYLRYVVQAKKLDPRSARYKALKHVVDKRFQLDILQEFADLHHAIPLYCFYNWLPHGGTISDLCHRGGASTQLGCTLVPLAVVRRVNDARMSKSYANLHGDLEALPWRCILCEGDAGSLSGAGILRSHKAPQEVQLPAALRYAVDTFQSIRLDDLDYSSALGGWPRRILVLDRPELVVA